MIRMNKIPNPIAYLVTALLMSIVITGYTANCIYTLNYPTCYSFSPCPTVCPTCADFWECNQAGGGCSATSDTCVTGEAVSTCMTTSVNWTCVKFHWVFPDCPSNCGLSKQILDSASGTCTKFWQVISCQ